MQQHSTPLATLSPVPAMHETDSAPSWDLTRPKPGRRRDSRVVIRLERPSPHLPIIHEETVWRRPDGPQRMDRKKLIVSRWRGSDRGEHTFEIVGDYHILGIALQPSQFSLWLGSKAVPHRQIVPGAIQITPPGLTTRVIYAQPYDVLHLHISNLLLMECFEWTHGKKPTDKIALRDPLPAKDALLHGLGTTLASIAGDPNSCMFAEFLGLAIVTHILSRYGDIAPAADRRAGALPKWRLKHATEFIEARLGSPLTLADVAGAAGLSRMHFAAQFRAATGVRPHEYVLQRRIEKAQYMLNTTDIPIAELALMVGFSSQSHFTVVFKRIMGLTPGRWRQSRRM